MKTHARVVVIGGGICGCSLLYHFTKLGWSDVVLVEKDELTAGSTWHAAGNTPHYDTSLNMMRLIRYSTELYESLEAETGQPTGFEKCGSIRTTVLKDRVYQFKQLEAQAKHAGTEFHIIGPNEIKDIFPFISLDGIICAAWTPQDGYTDPASTTHALAKGGRMGGAEIYRHTRCLDVRRLPSGEWEVVTDKGNIICEHVVNAAGTWARDLGLISGISLPIVSMEHQYLVTDEIDEVKQWGKKFPLLRDPDASFYLRREKMGMIFGPYEREGALFGAYGIPKEFGADLLPPDTDRIDYIVEMACERVPCLGTTGIKQIVNGPIPHAPDGGPLIGPVAGNPNYWALNGFSVGISQGGGAGKYLAEWIVEGEPSMEMFEFDPRRFGPYAGIEYTIDRSKEVYAMMYAVSYPGEERPAGRPCKTTPLYQRLKEQGAAFEARYGWERAAWFAPKGAKAEAELTFDRPNWFPYVANEVKAVRERVGVLDLSGFSKFEVSGPGAEAYLDGICANRPPRKIGGIILTQLLTPKGKIESEATICRLAADRFYLLTAAVAQTHDYDWLTKHLPRDGGVTLVDITTGWGVLVVAGPKSRELLLKLTHEDLSNAGFPWLSEREIEIGGIPVRAMRVNYVGELGWELHHEMPYQVPLYEKIMAAGADLGVANFGTAAMNSMRLEKAYRAWGSDMNVEVTPIEAGLDRLVKRKDRAFIGKDAIEKQLAEGIRWRCVLMKVDSPERDAVTNAPIYEDEKVIGIVSSGGYGHTVGSSLALGYVPLEKAKEGATVEVDVYGERRKAVVVPDAIYDIDNQRPRM
jgi:dimethylglycine dehydrogenase